MLIENAIREIRQADHERNRRIMERRRVRLPVARVDHVLHELEEIHLRGGIKVPAAMIPRIERLVASLPPECQTQFPLRTTITRVMDNLYAIQDCLLSIKDRRRRELQQQDGSLEEGDPAA